MAVSLGRGFGFVSGGLLSLQSKLQAAANARAALQSLGFLWLGEPDVTFADIPECSVRHVDSA